MPADELFSENSLEISQHARIDGISLRFEKAWLSGRSPSLEEHVEQIGDSPKLRRALYRELLALEIHYRKQKGEEPTLEEYWRRFPEFSGTSSRLFGRAAPSDSSIDATSSPKSGLSASCQSDSLSFDASSTSRQAAEGGERPRKLGRYEIVKLVGKGKFGRVYLGKDTQLDRLVAIKVSRSRLFSSEESAAVFLGEARKAAQLDKHSDIVTIHDVGEWGKKCYIVMDYIEGGTLADPKIEQDLQHSEIATLLAQVADAVHFAHRKGVVHRDIKPGNILLDGAGNPKVTDFGLAVYESEQSGKKGEISGTLLYMSPEQAGGHTERLDGRTDVWSLGATLYELLTKRTPFSGNTSDEVIDQILHREVKPPRQIDDTIPVELERICLKALSKQPTERYNTARDLARDLRRVAAKLEQARATRRRRIGMVLAAVVATIVIGIVVRPNDRPAPIDDGPGPPEPIFERIVGFRNSHDVRVVSVQSWNDSIASADLAGTVSLYHCPTEKRQTFAIGAPATCLATCGNRLVVLCENSIASIDPETGSNSVLPLPEGHSSTLLPNTSNELLICWTTDTELRGRFITNSTSEFSWPLPATLTCLTAASANDRIVVAGFAESENRWHVRIANLARPGTELYDLCPEISGPVCSLGISDSGRVVVGGWGPVGIYLAGIGTTPFQLHDPSDSGEFYHRVAISPDDRYVFAVSCIVPVQGPESSVLRVWSIDSDPPLGERAKLEDEKYLHFPVQAAAFLPDKNQILVAGSESIELWQVQWNTPPGD